MKFNEIQESKTSAPKDTRSNGAGDVINVPVMTSDIAKIKNLADCFLPPPGTSDESAQMQSYVNALLSALSTIQYSVTTSPGGTSKEKAYYLRHKLYERIDECFDILGKAKTSGITIPNNPFITVMQMNSARQLFDNLTIKAADATTIIKDINSLISFILDVKAGKYVLKQNPLSSYAQISSYAVGVEGIGNQSVNDLLGYVPGGDKFKLNRALESLNSLNFNKRIPRLMFTADFSPDGLETKGAIIGWKKMPDASGYIITRHNIFENIDDVVTLTNSQVKNTTEAIREYIETWVLSFYHNVDSKTISAWLDTTAEQDKMYTYSIQAFQNAMPSVGSIFVVNRMPVKLSPAKLEEARREILKVVASLPSNRKSFNLATATLVQSNLTRALQDATITQAPIVATKVASAPLQSFAGMTEDDISPYPHLSKKIYDDSNFDWILAAINVRASFERKDTIEKIRSFSYLGSSFSFITNEMSLGNFYVPEDLGNIVKRVEESLSSFGLTKTLVEILDATGLLFFFGEKDVSEDGIASGFSLDGSMLSTILSAIDPETATINPKTLATNMNTTIKNYSKNSTIISKFKELNMNLETSHFEDDVIADDAAQFVGELKADGELIDLTTFDGISRLMRTIRTYFDNNANRGKG